MMFGYITLMFSLSDYALAIGRSEQDSTTVVALLNLGAAVGRPAIGYLSDRYGRVEVAGLLTATCGVLVFVLWLPTSVYGILLAFALVDGAILGIFWAVRFSHAINLTVDTDFLECICRSLGHYQPTSLGLGSCRLSYQ